MINKNLLDELNRLGFGADVDAIESYVALLQEANALGNPIVKDVVYEQHCKLLKELRPDSYVLGRELEVEDNDLNVYDGILAKCSMKSICTIQKMSDLHKFKNALGNQTVTLTATVKLKGYDVRVVYVHGVLTTGSTRGKYKKGREITRHLKAILPNYIEEWKDIRLVEVRGELIVSLDKFEKLRHILKTPLSAVTSLLRESVTDDELGYLSCICYKVIPDTNDILKLDTLWDELDHLEKCGFEIPVRTQIEDVNIYNIDIAVDDLLNYFGEQVDDGLIKYETDGVVVSIDDLNQFYNMGMDDNTFLGNVVLKMGHHWESNIYSSTILEVIFEQEKYYITPKAIIEPVITVTGSEVAKVPLYNVGIMEKYGLTPGNTIYFRYEGEMNAKTCTEDGTSVITLD